MKKGNKQPIDFGFSNTSGNTDSLNFNAKYHFSLGLGVGKSIWKDKGNTLKLKVGMIYNLEQFTNNDIDNRYASMNEYLPYSYKLNASQDISSFEDYEMVGVLGLTVNLVAYLSIRFEQEIRYNNMPTMGFEYTDTKSIIRVGYSF